MPTSFPDYNIIEDYFYSNFNLAYETNNPIKDYFVKNENNYKADFINIFNIQPLFFEWKDYRFPVFIHQNENSLFNEKGQINFDLFLNVFLFLSGWQEKICNIKDEHSRFPFKQSLQYKYNFIKIPVVNIYYELLYETILKNNIQIERKKFKNNLIFTHDIDQLRSGWFENIQFFREELSLKNCYNICTNILSKTLRIKDDYLKGMERMLAIDKENNIEAISFFIPIKSRKDADFELKKIKFFKILKEAQLTQEIGIHPGYNTFNNIQEYKKQLNKLEESADQKITKSRQHFLRYNINKTPFIQESLNIQEDYTLGFAEHFGFRNGVTNSFHLFNFKTNKAFSVKQFPLVFMDVSLINYDLDKDFNPVILFLQKAKKDFNCNFSILFHNSVFSEIKYKGFERFYKQIISL